MKKLIFALLVLISISMAAAASFNIDITPIKDRILPEETAEFNLTITNNGNQTDNFKIFQPSWTLRSDPISDYLSGMVVNVGESKSTKILITPRGDYRYGAHGVEIRVKAREMGEEVVNYAKIFVTSGEKVEYVPNIQAYIIFKNPNGADGKIDPTQPVEVNIDFRNQNTRNIPEFTVWLRSTITDERLTGQVEPRGKGIIQETIELDPLTPPQELTIEFIFSEGGERFKAVDKEIEILPVDKPFATKTTSIKQFLKETTTIEVTSTSNIIKNETVLLETSLMNRIFTRAKADDVVKQNGESFYAWNIELNPGEVIELKAVKSYRSALVILIIIILLIMGYYMIRPQVTIKKSAVRTAKEGGMQEVKVMLTIKNLSKNVVKNLRIIDIVPNIAALVKEEEAGTLQPSKIRTYERTGTHLEWEIPEIARYEERIIRYKIRTKLNVVGSLKLPNAEVSYRIDDKTKKSYSSKALTGE